MNCDEYIKLLEHAERTQELAETWEYFKDRILDFALEAADVVCDKELTELDHQALVNLCDQCYSLLKFVNVHREIANDMMKQAGKQLGTKEAIEARRANESEIWLWQMEHKDAKRLKEQCNDFTFDELEPICPNEIDEFAPDFGNFEDDELQDYPPHRAWDAVNPPESSRWDIGERN